MRLLPVLNLTSVAGAARADIDSGVSLYAPHGSTSGGIAAAPESSGFYCTWIRPGTNTCSAIGRFGNGGVGNVVGPGTKAVSMSFVKSVYFPPRGKSEATGGRGNLEPLQSSQLCAAEHVRDAGSNNNGFGTISAVQTAEGVGPRMIEFTARSPSKALCSPRDLPRKPAAASAEPWISGAG